MSDFFDRLEEQLVERARRDVPRRARLRWSRRTLAFAALAVLGLVVVPAVAAVTGVFSGEASRHHLPAGPGLVDLSESCAQKDPARGKTTTDPPPAELTALLAILRRPQTPADRLPESRLGLFHSDGVNPDYVRRAKSSNGVTAYLIPAQNVRFFPPPTSDSPGCANVNPPNVKPEAGVCLHVSNGASCAPIDGIKSGRTLLTQGGSGRGTTLAAGIVPDGVRTVIWRVRRGNGFLDTRIPVRDNVYAGRFPGRHGHGLYVYFVDKTGTHLVIGPRRLTPKQRAQAKRDAALDRAAGPRPQVSPASGGTRTLFTLRMRVANPRARYIYAVTIRGGRPGDCGKPYAYRIGVLPDQKAPRLGLIKVSFGAGDGGTPWCRGTYRGTITKLRSASRQAHGPVVGRFSVDVG